MGKTNPRDLLKTGMGMAGNAKKAKKYGVTLRENMLLAYEHKTPKFVPNMLSDAGIVLPLVDADRYSGNTRGYDDWGVEWIFVPEQNAPMPVPGKYVFEEMSEWREKVKIPDLDAIDWKKQADHDMHGDAISIISGNGYKRLKNNKTPLDGGKLGVAMLAMGMFERMHALMGFENALIALIEEPEECYEFFGAVADYKIKLFHKIKEYYPGIEVINAHDDYGSTDSMLISPDMFRELLKPHLKRMVDAAHELGFIYQHHSCGKIEPILKDFIEISVDALDPLQWDANPNIDTLKHQYETELCFVGGSDNVGVFDRVDATDEECKAEYRRTLRELAPGGSYIAFPGGLTTTHTIAILAEHFAIREKMY